MFDVYHGRMAESGYFCTFRYSRFGATDVATQADRSPTLNDLERRMLTHPLLHTALGGVIGAVTVAVLIKLLR